MFYYSPQSTRRSQVGLLLFIVNNRTVETRIKSWELKFAFYRRTGERALARSSPYHRLIRPIRRPLYLYTHAPQLRIDPSIRSTNKSLQSSESKVDTGSRSVSSTIDRSVTATRQQHQLFPYKKKKKKNDEKERKDNVS